AARAPQAARNETERPLPPYTPAELPKRPAPEVNSPEEPWSSATRSNLSILSAPPPPRRAPGVPGWRWLLVPIFLAIAGLAGFFVYRDAAISKTTAPPILTLGNETALPLRQTARPLKLSVTEQQNQLDVSCNRRATSVM